MNKKYVLTTVLAIFILSLIVLNFEGTETLQIDDDKTQITVSFYPLEYFANQIGGEKIEVNRLLPDNTDVHHWHPETSHIVEAEQSDILAYNGEHVDPWFESDILETVDTDDKTVIETTQNITLMNEVDDSHTWTSPNTALKQAESIYQALVDIDSENEDHYTENWNNLKDKLENLDQKYLEEFNESENNKIVLTHAAFGFLAERYGFEQISVIGAAADEQPSAETLTQISETIEENNISVIFDDPVHSSEYAETLANEYAEDTEIKNLYLMLGTIDGMDYMEQMEHNLDIISRNL